MLQLHPPSVVYLKTKKQNSCTIDVALILQYYFCIIVLLFFLYSSKCHCIWWLLLSEVHRIRGRFTYRAHRLAQWISSVVVIGQSLGPIQSRVCPVQCWGSTACSLGNGHWKHIVGARRGMAPGWEASASQHWGSVPFRWLAAPTHDRFPTIRLWGHPQGNQCALTPRRPLAHWPPEYSSGSFGATEPWGGWAALDWAVCVLSVLSLCTCQVCNLLHGKWMCCIVFSWRAFNQMWT